MLKINHLFFSILVKYGKSNLKQTDVKMNQTFLKLEHLSVCLFVCLSEGRIFKKDFENNNKQNYGNKRNHRKRKR